MDDDSGIPKRRREMFTHDLQSNSEFHMSDYASEAVRCQTLSAIKQAEGQKSESKLVQPWSVRWMLARIGHYHSEHSGPRFVRKHGFRDMYRGSFGNSGR